MNSCLVLEDGTFYQGQGFGSRGTKTGEVVFNTSMTGYQEILTDPASYGQIVVFAYPLLGNYGIILEDNDSVSAMAQGLVTRELCAHPSNWRSMMSLEDFCKQKNLIGLSGIDTRALVRHLVRKGSMYGVITTEEHDVGKLVRMAQETAAAERDLVRDVSTKEARVFGQGSKKVVVVDLGVRQSLIRYLVEQNLTVVLVSALSTVEEILSYHPAGVVFAGGPGSPQFAPYAVTHVQQLLGRVPLLGIALGHLVLGLAWGGKVLKLKAGHCGGNQPIRDLESNSVFVTSQNHHYFVDRDSLPEDVVVTQVNLHDGTVEGMKHRKLPAFAFQYYPVVNPDVFDINRYFDEFLVML
ncbi:MAG: glutamine-hydrolyzing carbamoyl-phosphate synthase small subunit [Thermacetogeniaceae bacterium]|nr:glutamine-hydrolyzing carbamoyl-phosphate synthase small subunit [Thermoanaerobacterales bacterium]NLN21910.1 glutamine-hydrolyzing carbamoyl-phosphate synthase small subunit [Syntrophomonadaceae bacterium]